MLFFPVITRELRVSARQPFTYTLRTLGAGALLMASTFFGLEQGFSPSLGGRMFSGLHFTLFWTIWLLVPMATADCISRERREGTLGLLFLTHLKGQDIVIAKSMAHGLRALTLWVAVLPIATVPFLLGGVSWSQVVLSGMVTLCALCWALAAGLLASAWNKKWLRAMFWAGFLAIAFVLALGTAVGELLVRVYAPSGYFGWRESSDFAFTLGLGFILGLDWRYMAIAQGARMGQMLWVIGQITLLSMAALLLAVVLAGVKTRMVWQEEPPSRSQVWLEKTFCTPVLWLSFFRRWMRRILERNPMGWLEQRTWSGRLVMWGWFAVVISLYSGALMDPNFLRNSGPFQEVVGLLLAGSLGMNAAGSFRRERESGVMELLLVSPMSERRMIAGRLRGLWAQFLPSFGLFLLIWAYLSTWSEGASSIGAIFFFGVTYVTIPVIGLYFSLRCRGFIAAVLGTLTFGLLIPICVPVLLWWFSPTVSSNPDLGRDLLKAAMSAFCQFVAALVCWERLHWRLRLRAFPVQRAEV
jgi:ABC-type transport system involved in multi-copper enzyme maturation permease subunit